MSGVSARPPSAAAIERTGRARSASVDAIMSSGWEDRRRIEAIVREKPLDDSFKREGTLLDLYTNAVLVCSYYIMAAGSWPFGLPNSLQKLNRVFSESPSQNDACISEIPPAADLSLKKGAESGRRKIAQFHYRSKLRIFAIQPPTTPQYNCR